MEQNKGRRPHSRAVLGIGSSPFASQYRQSLYLLHWEKKDSKRKGEEIAIIAAFADGVGGGGGLIPTTAKNVVFYFYSECMLRSS